MNLMVQEIRQQPAVITRLLFKEKRNVERIAAEIRTHHISNIIICARGTSDNAATLARYLLEYVTGTPTSLAMPSLYTLYQRQIKVENTLVIGISQSGETKDVIEVLRTLKKSGALTLAITNENDSTLTKIAEYSIYCHAGKEKSIAATKTYTTQLTVMYLLAGFIAQDKWLLSRLTFIPKYINRILSEEKQIRRLITRYQYIDRCIVLGRGLNYPTALETALKIKETCYIPAQAYSSADFLHGPIATVRAGLPVLLYAPVDPTLPGQRELANKLKNQKTELIVISPDKKILSLAKVPVNVPTEIPYLFAPLVYIVFGQLFAYYLSLTKGYNPSSPKGLSKITQISRTGL